MSDPSALAMTEGPASAQQGLDWLASGRMLG